MEMEDSGLFSDLMLQNTGRRTHFRVPQRGDNVQMVQLARENALQEAERVTSREERISGTLQLLGKMLSLKQPPRRMESFDISNIAGTDIVASMVVFFGWKALQKDYKRFKVGGAGGSERLCLHAASGDAPFCPLPEGDAGFDQGPDLLLIDGGTVHAETARRALEALELSFPVFGMVKDHKHRTRVL